MFGPDATATLDFALVRLTGVIEKMMVYPDAMNANMEKLGGLVHSQRVLLALTQAGLSREDSYLAVQRNAMKVWALPEAEREGAFLNFLQTDEEVRRQGLGRGSRGFLRPRLPHPTCRHDLRTRVWQRLTAG